MLILSQRARIWRVDTKELALLSIGKVTLDLAQWRDNSTIKDAFFVIMGTLPTEKSRKSFFVKASGFAPAGFKSYVRFLVLASLIVPSEAVDVPRLLNGLVVTIMHITWAGFTRLYSLFFGVNVLGITSGAIQPSMWEVSSHWVVNVVCALIFFLWYRYKFGVMWYAGFITFVMQLCSAFVDKTHIIALFFWIGAYILGTLAINFGRWIGKWWESNLS